jgi:N-acetylmuramate 1-kinase
MLESHHTVGRAAATLPTRAPTRHLRGQIAPSVRANRLPHTVDPRRDTLERWLRAQLPEASFSLVPASEDASFRRYFRATLGDGRSVIVMDAPPEREPCAAFVQVAALLREAGVNAPEVLAQDLAQGFLLLTDLGRRTYLDALEADRSAAAALFEDATEALLRWQRASRPGVLPDYDAARLRAEMTLFPQWYLGRHLGIALSSEQASALERVFALLIASATAQPQVFVHRDYMPRNLMLSEPNPGVLDFQDAVLGPISYDIVSLLRDAFISWDEAQVLDWCLRYWERARAAGLPVDPDFSEFFRAFEWMGLQRHLKVLGIFARLTHRDGKAKYVADTPRFLRYARAVAERYAPLASLAQLLQELDGAAPRSASAFR